ncbi:hypothetical protein H072_4396 [Dactylellina haptotyla CBS 200.50]|uniref:Uncharacterized protein n=1 Tax=Dactylellina haptotyla (strain CBS 200.50) TaxID=1284197 RepID=S8AF49_DACHA|nr:hypothetical protein H072_4396 [Dactylellina haptotyla CBS 200.50]
MATLLRTIKPKNLTPFISVSPNYALQRPLVLRPIRSSLLTQRYLSTQRTSPHGSPKPDEVSHEMPRISWKDLGASRTVKIVVIVALSIVGTMETIFYFKMFMRKFFPDKEEEVEEGSNSSSSATAA